MEISKVQREPHFHMPESHSHDFYELYYLLSGECRIFINHTIYDLTAGDFVLISPTQIHRVIYHSELTAERFALLFSAQELEDMKKNCPKDSFSYLLSHSFLRIPDSFRSRIETCLEQMNQEMLHNDDYSSLQMKSILCQLFVFLGRIWHTFSDEAVNQPVLQQLDSAEEAIQTAALYLYHHYRESVSLNEIAGIIHMSPSYFSRRFKKATGFGFKEYLTIVRLQAACYLLASTSDSVTDIALSCGFPDGNYFGDVFKKRKGCSPLQYRKKKK